MPALTDPVLTALPVDQPHLVAGDLLLRPWKDDDAAALLEVYADPDVRRWHVERLDSAEAWAYAARWADLWRTGRRAGWAVERDGVLSGRVTLTRIVLEGGQAEVTYWTVPAARGQGVAPAAVEAVSAWAFNLGFHRLELQHSTQNSASCRVAEKAGFEAEGTKRAAGLHLDGWHDMHLHARVGG